MKLGAHQIDLRSFLIGLLVAAITLLLVIGRPSQAQSGGVSIFAGDGGVYIVKGGTVFWRSKDKCSTYSGCAP